MSTVILCHHRTFPLRRILYCSNCKRRRRVAGLDRGAWYGVMWTCCGCGDSWADGELLERPFQRGWRQKEIARAKRIWEEAGQYARKDWREWIQKELYGRRYESTVSI